ncbi:MAG: methyltransferase domain-containing protein [Spirochaetaceae bacterium]
MLQSALRCGNDTPRRYHRRLLHLVKRHSTWAAERGVDCFPAARRVGPRGRVLGVDMTPEMVEKARHNARQNEYANVEFRLGEIEALPLADASVDLIISNCVINLSPSKDVVFREAFRVRKPGGRLVVSDTVAEREPTDKERANMDLYSACVSGAERVETVRRLVSNAGFADVQIDQASTPFDWGGCDTPVVTVYSATISGRKPAHSATWPDPHEHTSPGV